MACKGPNPGNFPVAKPGDRVTVWLDRCSPMYFVDAYRTIVHDQQKDSARVFETQLGHASPLTYIHQADEMFVFTVYFDPRASTKGKSCEVHARITAPDGSERARWCCLIESGTPDPDIATLIVKGA